MNGRVARVAAGWRVPTVVALTTLALLLALWPGSPIGLWPGTLIAGAIGMAAALASSRAELAPLLRPTVPAVLGGLLAGGVMAGLTHATYRLAVLALPAVSVEAASLYQRLDNPPGMHAVLPVVALVVVAEELVWRGLAYGWLVRRVGARTALLAASLLYALPQLSSGSWLLPVLGFCCGIIWTAQRASSGNLVLPTVTHLTWDVLVLSAFPLAS